MSQIGTLITGAGVVTTINLQYVPEFIFIGEPYQQQNISAISWNVAGQELVNVSGGDPVNALSKFKNQGSLSSGEVNTIFNTGYGYLGNQQFQLRITNNAATTPGVFAFSRKRGNGQVFTASQQVVLAGANQRYSNFLGLQFDPSFVGRVDVNFRNPATGQEFSESFDPIELNALFGLDQISEDGFLNALAVIDNTNIISKFGVMIKDATIYATTVNVTVTQIGLSSL
jgi:hypothetical protein